MNKIEVQISAGDSMPVLNSYLELHRSAEAYRIECPELSFRLQIIVPEEKITLHSRLREARLQLECSNRERNGFSERQLGPVACVDGILHGCVEDLLSIGEEFEFTLSVKQERSTWICFGEHSLRKFEDFLSV